MNFRTLRLALTALLLLPIVASHARDAQQQPRDNQRATTTVGTKKITVNAAPTRLNTAQKNVQHEHGHEQQIKTHASRPPIAVSKPATTVSLLSKQDRQAAAVCTVSQFESATGSTLTSLVKNADLSCLNQLFGVSGTQAYNIFNESKMTTIAYALRDNGVNYPGSNATFTLQLVTFLRAGYYVQFYQSDSVGTYGQTLKTAIQAGLDAFFNNANSMIVNDANGQVLSEAVVLIDSATENARFVYKIKDMLNRYDSAWQQSWYMNSAANSVFTVTFRGHQNADFKTLIQSDQSLIDALYNFYNRWTSLLGTDNEYLVTNAAREVGRFLQYSGTVKSKTQPLVRQAINQSNITGSTAPIWVGLSDMVDYYDKANCNYYGNVCDYKARINNEVLVVSHTCSNTLKVRAQEVTSAQLTTICNDLATSTARFHTMLETNYTPVAGDLNAALELVIWNSSTDYGTYAGALFGIDTNNGGMYLEGNPTQAGNQARFIAYEAEWLRPTFKVWNLEHESNHYLDGRFDMQGDFGTYLTANTIWWIEGLAEYVAYVNNNPSALDVISNATHVPLSTVFRNTYNSGTDRVYRWGYVAVRFMFERHMSDVRTMLSYFRNGNYTSYDSYLLNTIGTRYDSEFQTWLQGVLNGSSNQAPTANFSSTASGLTVTFSDSSSDSDGTITSRAWNFGDGTTSTATNPSKTYATAGTYSVSLTVTDNQGATQSVTKSVTVSNNSGSVLQNGVAKTGLSAAQGATLNYTMSVPAGASNLRFVMSGGSGDADLYVRFGSAPTTSTYDCRPYLSGNNETCTITTAQAGTYYVMMRAYSAFSAVSLTGSYTAGTGNQTPVANFNSAANGLTVTFTDTSSDSDGTIASRAWNFGDGTTSTANNPNKTYASAGTYSVALTVTDNQGASNTITKAVTVSSAPTITECTAADARALGQNCKRSNRTATQGNYDYLFINMPTGVAQLKITTSGGTGNANLYVSTNGWATQTNYQYVSSNSGNTESVTIQSPPSGYIYISLHGITNFSGVTVTTQY